MKETKKIKYRYLSFVLFVVGLLFAATIIPTPVFDDKGYIREWRKVDDIWSPALAEYTPGGNAGVPYSGFLEIFIVANSDTTYATNVTTYLSNTSIDDFWLEIPHDTYFDFVVKAQFNKTHCYVLGNTTWVLAYASCEICSTGNASGNLDIDGITMNRTKVADNGSSDNSVMWVNFYIQINAGTTGNRLEIGRDATAEIDHINLSAYW